MSERRSSSRRLYSLLAFASTLFVMLSLYGCGGPAPRAPPIGNKDCGSLPHGACSPTLPYYCQNGALAPNPQQCGCPAGEAVSGNACAPVPPCPDGTSLGACSADQPLFCANGTLIGRASTCGCPGGFSPLADDSCQNDTAGKAEALEQLIHAQVNLMREQANRSPLAWNEPLAGVARAHSADMAQRDYFEHINPEGEAPADRYARHDYTCQVVDAQSHSDNPTQTRYLTAGENLFSSWLFDSPADEGRPGVRPEFRSLDALANATVAGWMTSPEHRDNLLTPEWQTEGIGVHIQSNHQVLITQNFC